MTIPAGVLAQMAVIGLTAEQAAAVAAMLSSVEAATKAESDAGREASKAKARARFRKWKATHADANVSKRSETLANGSRESAGVEDNFLPQKIEPQEESKKAQSAQARVGQAKASRLPEDWVLPVEWRADALAAGLPESRIDLEADKMRDWSRSSRNGAKIDWRATWRNWCREAAGRLPQARGSPARPTLADGFKQIAEMAEYRNAARGGFSDGVGGPQPAIPDLSIVSGGRSR